MLGSVLAAAGPGALGTLFVKLTADSTDLVRGMNMAETSIAKSSAVMLKTVAGLGAGIAVAMTGIAVLGLREFGKFEAAMIKATSIMGDVSVGMRKEMELTARTIAKESTTSAEKLGEAYFFLASAGLSAEQAQAALSEVNKFAIAGMFDLNTATTMLMDSQSALGLRSKDVAENMKGMKRVMDVLSKANILSNAEIQQFAEALTNKAAAALRLVNKDVEEGVAVLAAYADRGIKGANAGEQMAIMMRDLQSAAIENKKQFSDMGITVFDAAGKMKPLVSIIRDMEIALGTLSDQEKREAFTLLGMQDRSIGATLALIGASGAIEEYERKLRTAAGATQEIAEKMEAGFNAQLIILWHNIQDVLITIGEKMVPVLRTLNGMFKDSTAGSDSFGKSINTFTDTFAPAFLIVIGEIGDAIWGWQVIIKTGQLAFASFLLFAAQMGTSVAKGFMVVVESIAKGLESVANAAIFTLNVFLDEADQMDEIKIGFKFDRTTLDADVAGLKEDLATTQNEFDQMMMGGSFSDRLKASYAKATAAVVEENKKLVADVDATTQKVAASFEQIEKARAAAAAKEFAGQTKGIEMPGTSSVLGMTEDPAMAAMDQFLKEKTIAEDRLMMVETMAEMELAATERVSEEKIALLVAYNERVKALQMAQAQIVFNTSSKMFTDLASIAEAFGGKQSAAYKAMFAASKAFAIAEATVKIAQGIAAAAANPWPLNLAAMGSVIAATASIVSSIQSVKLEFGGAKAEGGPVSSGKAFLVGEQGPEMFVPSRGGSIVPNDELGGGGGGVRVIINNFTDAKPEVKERNEGNEKVIEIMIRRVKNEIGSEIRDGRGDVTKSMESTFGLKRGKG